LIWLGPVISGDNWSSRIFWRNYKFQNELTKIVLWKTHALLRLANAVSPLPSTRGVQCPKIFLDSRIFSRGHGQFLCKENTWQTKHCWLFLPTSSGSNESRIDDATSKIICVQTGEIRTSTLRLLSSLSVQTVFCVSQMFWVFPDCSVWFIDFEIQVGGQRSGPRTVSWV